MGWRGDGTGRYPTADPPVTWGRASKAVKGLRFQGRRPKDAERGTSMPDGAWFGTGVAACYGLDGARKWIRVERRPEIEHGFSSSPLLVDGKLVVFQRDLLAFDAATGKLAWQIPLVSHEGFNPRGYFHGSPVAATVGGVQIIALGNGTIVRASHWAERQERFIANPVFDGQRLYLRGEGTLYAIGQ